MISKRFLQQLKNGDYVHGPVFEFDWYIDLIFMEAMAFHNNPIFFGFFQPIVGDEFLDPKNLPKIMDNFNDFFQNQKNIKCLIKNQNNIIKSADKLINEIKNRQVIDLEKYIEVQKDLAQLMASVSVVFDSVISKEIENISKKELISVYKISSYVIGKSSKTKINESNVKLLEIYEKHKNKSSTFNECLTKHSQEYAWLNLDGRGKKEWTVENFIQQLESLSKKSKKKMTIVDLDKLSKKSSKLINSFIQININDNVASDKQFELDYLFQKYLKDKLGKNYIEEILENLSFEEICKIIKNPESIKKFKNKKNNYYRVAWPENGKIFSHYFTNKKEFEKIVKIIHDEEKQILEIKGVVACLGKAKGIVHIIKSPRDLKDFKEGEILVASYTAPSYTETMYKAGAIVTDVGGITSHAAIVSREFNIPCIVGTKNATKLLKDGDNVMVDATTGEVKII